MDETKECNVSRKKILSRYRKKIVETQRFGGDRAVSMLYMSKECTEVNKRRSHWTMSSLWRYAGLRNIYYFLKGHFLYSNIISILN